MFEQHRRETTNLNKFEFVQTKQSNLKIDLKSYQDEKIKSLDNIKIHGDNETISETFSVFENVGVVSVSKLNFQKQKESNKIWLDLLTNYKSLVSISLNNAQIDDADCLTIASMTKLTNIDLSCNNINNDGCHHLSKIPQRINNLNLRENSFDYNGLISIVNSTKITGIDHLNITNNRCVDGVFLNRSNTIKINMITACNNNNMTKVLQHLNLSHTLDKLNLDNCTNNQKSMTACFNTLKVISISMKNNEISIIDNQNELFKINGMLIQELDLSYNRINNEICSSISNELENLYTLRLESCSLNDLSIAHLLGNLNFRMSIKCLDLTNNNITNVSCDMFQWLCYDSIDIEFINITNNDVDKTGIDRIKKQRNCRLIWNDKRKAQENEKCIIL
jgi:hypothetical protein